MNVDVYIFFKIYRDFFKKKLSFLCSVFAHIARDRSVSVPAESAAETTTMNHGENERQRETERGKEKFEFNLFRILILLCVVYRN